MRTRQLLRLPLFWLLILLMVCAGASEASMAQWASAFTESAMGVSKTVGDLAGPCLFAVFMGISRILYGKLSEKLDLTKTMLACGILCVICYLMASLSAIPVIGLAGCALCGVSVGIMWPGTISITGLFSKIGDFFSDLFKDAFNWGKNLIQNIGDGIKKAWNWVVDGVKGVGQSIADFLGFGSPTKKGPGHTADEWIPNLMDMMAQGMYEDIPMIQRAAIQVANALGLTTTNRAMVGVGTRPNGDLQGR